MKIKLSDLTLESLVILQEKISKVIVAANKDAMMDLLETELEINEFARDIRIKNDIRN